MLQFLIFFLTFFKRVPKKGLRCFIKVNQLGNFACCHSYLCHDEEKQKD
jgi:hypothetical protein